MKVLCGIVLLASALFPQGDYDPAPVERPKAPGRGKADIIVVPSSAELKRDSVIADRFTAERQTVTYVLRASAGELSLMTLDTVGYARGWQSAARIRILDAKSGEVLYERNREGGTVYRMFIPFEAPADGIYSVELTCPKQFFRYVLTRNSQFRPRGAKPIPIGDRTALHGYLRDPATDIARYALDLAEGEEVLLTVRNDEAPARQADFAGRLKAANKGELDLLRGERMPVAPKAGRGGAARGATVGDHPNYFLRVFEGPNQRIAPTPCSRFTATTAGTYLIEIVANGAGEGGFFELGIDRAPAMVAGKGFVDDPEGDPVAGVDLQFFREPGLDFLGRTTTDEEGQWTLQLPSDSYTVFLQVPGKALINVRTTVDGEHETNFIYGGREGPPMDK